MKKRVAGIYDIEGLKMYLDPKKKGIGGPLIKRGYREPCFMWILRKEARGELGVDIGSNIGYVTMSLCNQMDKVIAIEPDSRCSELMIKSAEANNFQDKLTLYDFAVSDVEEEKVIYMAEKYHNLNTLCDVSGVETKLHKFKKSTIQTKTIDSLNIEPNFIKMDIEGYEVEAIRGAMETLKRAKKCKLLIEVHPQYYSEERNFAKVLEDLYAIGFNVKYVVSAATPCPDLFKKKGYKPFKQMLDEKHKRGIFDGISKEDAINFCAYKHRQVVKRNGKISQKIARSILLVKE